MPSAWFSHASDGSEGEGFRGLRSAPDLQRQGAGALQPGGEFLGGDLDAQAVDFLFELPQLGEQGGVDGLGRREVIGGLLPDFPGCGEAAVGELRLLRLSAFSGVLELGLGGFEVCDDAGEFGFLGLDDLGGAGPGDHDVLQEAQFAGQALAALFQTRASAKAVAQAAAAADEILVGGQVAIDAVDPGVDVIHGLLMADHVVHLPADGFHGIPGIQQRAHLVRPGIVDAAAFFRPVGADVPTAEMMGDAVVEGGAEFFRGDVAGDRGRAGEQGLDFIDLAGAGAQRLHGGGELRLAGEQDVPPGGFVSAEQGGELVLDLGGIGDAGGSVGLKAGKGSGTPGFLEGPAFGRRRGTGG